MLTTYVFDADTQEQINLLVFTTDKCHRVLDRFEANGWALPTVTYAVTCNGETQMAYEVSDEIFNTINSKSDIYKHWLDTGITALCRLPVLATVDNTVV